MLVNRNTGARYYGQGILNDYLIELSSIRTDDTLIGVGRVVLRTATNTVSRYEVNVMRDRYDGHSWVMTFEGVDEEVGNTLELEYFVQVYMTDSFHARDTFSDSLRFNGEWRMQMRELGYGSGV